MPSVRPATKATITALILSILGTAQALWGSAISGGWLITLALASLFISWVCETLEGRIDD